MPAVAVVNKRVRANNTLPHLGGRSWHTEYPAAVLADGFNNGALFNGLGWVGVAALLKQGCRRFEGRC